MKFYFFDTSAVVKRYHSEKGTEIIDRIFAETDRAIVISSKTEYYFGANEEFENSGFPAACRCSKL